MPLSFPAEMTESEIEANIINNFENLLKSKGYKISDFDEIYILNDGFDAWTGIYLNVKHIPYFWVQVSTNYDPPIEINYPQNYKSLLAKYSATTSAAEYCTPYVMANSDKTIEKLQEINKSFITWDVSKCKDEMSSNDLDKLFRLFGLTDFAFEPFKLNNSAMIIKNSNGYLKSISNYQKIAQYENYYTFSELISVMDLVSLDFYAPESQKIFIKFHIHSYMKEKETQRLYGENAINLPNVPFEILGKFMTLNKYKFNTIIGTCSTSLNSVDSNIGDNLYALGVDFSRCWWFYISIYAALLFAESLGFKEIYCDPPVLSQAIKLAETVGYKADFFELKDSQNRLNKDSLILIDMSECPDNFISTDEKQYTIIYFNTEFNNGSFFENSPNCLAPLQIKKEKLADIECDILYRDETLWVYSPDINVRKAAIRFVFERCLKNLGMKIFSERTPAPACLDMFYNKQSLAEKRALKKK